MVSFTNNQNIICRNQTQFGDIALEQTIICRYVICRSHGGLSANEKDQSNDNNIKDLSNHNT